MTTPVEAIFGPAAEAKNSNSAIFDQTSDIARSIHPWWDATGVQDHSLFLNWNKLFPYQLGTVTFKDDGGYTYEALYTLPIPPQQLNIDMQFASTVEATMGGVVETNNGIPFRDITLSGTTGMLTLRGTVTVPKRFSALDQIFAGTVNAISSVTQSVSKVAQLVGAPQPTPANLIPGAQSNEMISAANGTGFFHIMALQRVLEAYAEYKRVTKNSKTFLAFAVHKENSCYVVTPVSFSRPRSAASPMEYQFSLRLRAFRKLPLNDNISASYGSAYIPPLVVVDPKKILNTLDEARRGLEASKTVMQSITQDVDTTIFGTLRQAVLFLKDLGGVVATVADFPADLINDMVPSILEKMGAVNFIQSFVNQAVGVGKDYDRIKDNLLKAADELGLSDGIPFGGSTPGGTGNYHGSNATQTGGNVASAAAAGGYAGNSRGIFMHNWAAPAYYPILSQIKVSDLQMPPAIEARMEAERRRAAATTRADFERARINTLALLGNFSSRVGAGDATFDAIYGSPVSVQSKSVPSDEDWDIINGLAELVQIYDTLAASKTIDRTLSNVDYIAGLATKSGIAFTTPQSKFLIPFPYGYTLEHLAEQYLGSTERWIEIATLNGLQSPYVDEVGFFQPILVNGNGDQLVVADSSKYYVGQKVWVTSNSQPRELRHISSINRLSDTQSVLQLDGNPDLIKFTTVAQTKIQAFLPNTVNSLQYLYMPSSEQPAEEDFQIRDVPGVDYFDPYVRIGGVDLMLSSTGDLVISPGGTRLVSGLANVIQRAKIALSTPKGSVRLHPSFGIGIPVGSSTADISAQELLKAAKNMFGNNPNLSNFSYATVNKSGGQVQIGLGLKLNGVKRPIPITLNVAR